jgi:hypothetical protein
MSPRPKSKETESPVYLLLNFQSTPSLPQFLEFKIKGADKGANSCWQLVESSCTIAKETKAGFMPVKVSLTLNKQNIADPRSYSIYKLAHVISVIQESKSQRTHKKQKENVNPNTGGGVHIKSRNNKMKQGSNTISASHIKKPSVTANIANTSNSKPLAININTSKTNLVTNLKIIRSGSSSKPAVKIVKKDIPHTETEMKGNKSHNNTIQGTFTRPVSLSIDAMGPQMFTTLNQNSSLNSSINSTGLGSSKLKNRLRSRMSGYSDFDQSGVLEQFPSYSGNVTLLNTPSYSMATSGSNQNLNLGPNNYPQLVKQCAEQNEIIKVLQERLMILEHGGGSSVKQQQQNFSMCHSQGRINMRPSNKINMSADIGIPSKCKILNQHQLNLSHTASQNNCSAGLLLKEKTFCIPQYENTFDLDLNKGPQQPFSLDVSKIENQNEATNVINNVNCTETAPALIAIKKPALEEEKTRPPIIPKVLKKDCKSQKQVKLRPPTEDDIPKIIDPRVNPDSSISRAQIQPQVDPNDGLSAIKETNESIYSNEEEAARRKAANQKSNNKPVFNMHNKIANRQRM